MSTERKGTEVFVGLFLFLGFAFIAVMVVLFGRVSMGGQDTYQVTVEFPNASGIVAGSDVLLAGARIGTVAAAPSAPVVVGNSFRVAVKLNLRSDVQIPQQSNFVVGSSGLLGDRFVDVQPHQGFDPGLVIERNSQIPILGTTPGGGLNELTSKGGDVMDQLTKEMEKISEMLSRINEGLLHETNLKNLEATFANLKTTTENFKTTTAELDTIMQKMGGTLDAAKGTMETADGAAGDLRLAIKDLRKVADTANKTVDSAGMLVKNAANGNGAMGALINDPKLADDLRALVANLRRSGVLFYKNRPVPEATPAPKRRR